jgi:uncharacterized membrane protein YhhN
LTCHHLLGNNACGLATNEVAKKGEGTMAEESTGRWDRAPWLWLSALAAGASYMWPVLQDQSGPAIIAWKGAGVALLALWAAANARGSGGWMIAGVMAFGALGDVLIDAAGITAGALAFIGGHILAIALYVQNRRAELTQSQRWLAMLLAPTTALVSWLLTLSTDQALGVTLYACFLGMMATTAWASRFSRYRAGIGAVLFVISDWLIFARLGGRIDPDIARMLIWPLYFAGQAFIARGVVSRLATG